MALTQAQRISISLKLVDIPKEDAQANSVKDLIGESLDKVQDRDDANKSLMDDKTVFVNAYQGEYSNYDGNIRSSLVEQDLIDSVKKIQNNPFFPNDPLTPISPLVPDGVWKFFPPFSGSKAIGKNNVGVYPSDIEGETETISAIGALIAQMEGYTGVGRGTGQKCDSGVSGSCSIPMYLTQATCESNGGVWTAVDAIVNDPAIQATATALIDKVNQWKSLLVSTFSVIYTSDPDATRQAQNDAAKADITATLVIIDAWLANNTFYTSHGATTCVAFNGLDFSAFPATKFKASTLLPLKMELSDRSIFVINRNGQLMTNLGSIDQDASNGSIISATGFYGDRFRIIDLRLNLISGSLSKIYGLQSGIDVQDQLIASNDNAQTVYDSVMKASALSAPSIATENIHVVDASDFAVSDVVYVVAEDQAELTGTIIAISGNMVTLSFKVPQKYTTNNKSRLYKLV